MDLTDAAAAWRRDGFVVLPGYLDGPELKAAQRDLPVAYPTADEYHAAPEEGRNGAYTGDEFGGIIAFPFPSPALCNLVVHDKLIALAEAVFEFANGQADCRLRAVEALGGAREAAFFCDGEKDLKFAQIQVKTSESSISPDYQKQNKDKFD